MGGERIEDGNDANRLLTNNVGGVIVRGVFMDGKTNIKPTKTIQNT